MLRLLISILLFAELCSSQSTNLQNIETFYPVSGSASPAIPPPPSTAETPPSTVETPPSSRSDIAKAVAATAASTLVIAAVFFFVLQRYCLSRRQKQSTAVTPNPYAGAPAVIGSEFARVDGNVKGLIVDENGLDVLYWRKLEEREGRKSGGYVKEVLQKKQSRRETEQEDEIVIESDRRRDRSRRREPIQEIPLLREKSSTSYDFKRVQPEIEDKHQIQSVSPAPARSSSGKPPPARSSSVSTPQATPPPPPPPAMTSSAIPARMSPAPATTPPPPPPPPPVKKIAAGPPPPPPVPKSTGSKPPPPPPKLTPATSSPIEEESEVNGQVKLKPLHWDKVNTNPEHSMVWNKLDKGSFRFDGDLMEALFGYVATNRASPQNSPKPPSHATSSSSSSQITLLDPRKSQNTAIVLKSLGISRNALLSSLRQGQGLENETIEKLTRIAPTKDEVTKILSFAGDPATLADAESFLHRLLKSIPSAFSRLETMQFRSHYESEIVGIKESIRTLELGCEELRTRGLFMKLLEAILKAGNRMNAGTVRGNAQAFHLTALRKLSDVKSTDGKTTLLHFVVEEVVRSEGKRIALNNPNSNTKEEKEKQYTMLGLPVVGGLSSEFGNVKKAAGIDYDAFAGAVATLSKRVSESQRLVSICESDGAEGGGFVREMRGFLVNAHEELEVVGGEQRRVMELVRRTTEYYQAGASRERGAAAPLQLFVIVKDFLAMVDKVCVEIARNSQKKKAPAMGTAATTSSPAARSTVKFPILPKHFMSDKSGSSSGSDNE